MDLNATKNDKHIEGEAMNINKQMMNINENQWKSMRSHESQWKPLMNIKSIKTPDCKINKRIKQLDIIPICSGMSKHVLARSYPKKWLAWTCPTKNKCVGTNVFEKSDLARTHVLARTCPEKCFGPWQELVQKPSLARTSQKRMLWLEPVWKNVWPELVRKN